MTAVPRCAPPGPASPMPPRTLWTCARHQGTAGQCCTIGRDPAPRFIDFHDDPKLPAEAIEQIAAGTRPGATGEFGARQIERYHNADGKVCCLLEGPDEEAIRKHHQALGVPCGDVFQVSSLL